MRIRFHYPLIISLFFLTMVSLAYADTPRVEQETQFTRVSDVTGFTLMLPRYVYDQQVVVRVNAPATATPLATVTVADGKAIPCTVVLTHQGDHRQETLTLQLLAQYREVKEQKVLSGWQGSTVTKLADWPDGEIQGELQVPIPENERKNWPMPAAGHSQVICGLMTRVAVSSRDELRVWLDHANGRNNCWGMIPSWPNLERALAQPEHPYDNLRGFLLRSYAHPTLQRLQPYTLYVPEALDLSRPAPLLVLLHGSGGNYLNIIPDYASGQRMENSPMLVANIGLLRYSHFRHPLALQEIQAVIADVQRKYLVDNRRIYLQGISLGGRGALEVTALQPDRFTAISAQATYGLHDSTWDPVTMSEESGVAQRLNMKTDVRALLPNLTNTSTEILYGWRDKPWFTSCGQTVNVLLGDEMKDKLVMRGFDTGHNIGLPAYDWQTTREWMLKQEKNLQPDTVHLRVTNLRYGTSAWVQVLALTDYSRVGRVLASYNREKKTLDLTTVNIAEATFYPPGDVEGVTLNGTTVANVTWHVGDATLLHLSLQHTGKLQLTTGLSARSAKIPQKHSGQSGPIWDFWNRPCSYVYATGGSATTQAILQKSAMDSANWEGDISYGDPHLPVVAESALTAEQKQRNLVLFITPDDVKRFCGSQAKVWPLMYTKSSAGGLARDTFNMADARVALRPSPWAADAYILIVVVTGQRPVNLQALHWSQRELPSAVDWMLLCAPEVQAPKKQQFCSIIAAGVYDHQWRPGPWSLFSITPDDTPVP